MLDFVLDIGKRVFTKKKGGGLLGLKDAGEKMNKAYVLALIVRMVLPLIVAMLAYLISEWLGIPIGKLLDTSKEIKDTFAPSSVLVYHSALTPVILFVNGFDRRRTTLFRRKV